MFHYSRKNIFVNPPGPRDLYRGSVCTYLSKAKYVWKPKDFIMLSMRIPEGQSLEFLDASINGMGEKAALEWVVSHVPDTVFVALSSIHWEADRDFLFKLRSKLPHSEIMIFGEALLEPTLKRELRGAYDAIVSDPLKFVLHKNQEKIGLPRHELFEHPNYRWPFAKRKRHAAVFTQYGCAYNCTYCTEAITSQSFRPAQNVVQELVLLKNQGYQEFYFGDASFGLPRENAEAILKNMVANNINMSWSCYLHPAQGQPAFLDLMKQSGCHTIVMGIDSADENLLRSYRRGVTSMQVKGLVERAHARRIEVCGDIILGFPEDTVESCHLTTQFALDLGIDFLSVNIATPLLGSSIRKRYVSEGRIRANETGLDTSGKSGVVKTKTLSADSLIKLKKRAIRKFYARPLYLWKRLRQIGSWDELIMKASDGFSLLRSSILPT